MKVIRPSTIIGLIILFWISSTAFNMGTVLPKKVKDGKKWSRFIHKEKYDKWLKKWKRNTKNSSEAEINFRSQAYDGLKQILQKGEQALASENLRNANRSSSYYQKMIEGIKEIDPDFFTLESNIHFLKKIERIRSIPTVISSKLAFKGGNYVRAINKARSCEAKICKDNEKELLQKFTDIEWSRIEKLSGQNNLIKKATKIKFVDDILIDFKKNGLELETLPCPSNLINYSCNSFVPLLDTTRVRHITKLKSVASINYEDELFKIAFSQIDAALLIGKEGKIDLQVLRDTLYDNALKMLEKRKKEKVNQKEWDSARIVIDKLEEVEPAYPVSEEKNKVWYKEFFNKAQDSHSKGEWLDALKYWNQSMEYCEKIVCSPCCDEEEVERLIDDVISKIESQMDDFVLDRNLNSALLLVDKVKKVKNDYFSDCKKNTLKCKFYLNEGEIYFEQGNYLQALAEFFEAEKYCSKCGVSNNSDIKEWKDKIHDVLQGEVDELALENNDLNGSILLLEKISRIDSSFPLNRKKYRIECRFHFKKGKEYYNINDCLEAENSFKIALNKRNRANEECLKCPNKLEIEYQITEMRKCRAMLLLIAAEEAYNNGDCASAVLLIDEAMKLITIPEKYQYIRRKAFDCARKKIAIIIRQKGGAKFSSNEFAELASHLKSSLQSSLNQDEYADLISIVYSKAYYSSNVDPISEAKRRGADYALVIDVSQIKYSTTIDRTLSSSTYCKVREYFVGFDYCGRPVYRYAINGETAVNKYFDKAFASAYYEAVILDVEDGTEQNRIANRINKTWEQQRWRSNTAPSYIVYCGCPIRFLSNNDLAYFNNQAIAPTKQKLLLTPLKQKLARHSGQWRRALSELVANR